MRRSQIAKESYRVLLRARSRPPVSFKRIVLKDATNPDLQRVNANIVLTIVAPEPTSQLVRVNLIPLSRFVDRNMELADEAAAVVHLL